jgi:simple sugar transport system permease protein
VIGLTPAAGSYAGFSPHRVIWFTLVLGGGFAGLAGAMEVCGPIGQLMPTVSPGYGYTAIIAAFLGRLHPLGIVLASLLLALTYLGGDAAQIALAVPLAVTQVFQGMILFFLLAADVLIRYRVRLSARNPPEAPRGARPNSCPCRRTWRRWPAPPPPWSSPRWANWSPNAPGF